MNKRWIVLAGVGVVVIVLAAVLFDIMRPESVLAYQVKKEDVVATLTVTGEVRADATANVSAPVSARIVKMNVDAGDVIKTGQVLAELKPDEAAASVNEARARLSQEQANLQFITQGTREEELARQEAAYQQAQAQLNQSKAALQSARATLKDDQHNADRMTVLYKQEVISAQEYDDAVAKRDVAIQAVDQNAAAVDAAQRQVTQAHAQWAQGQNGPTPAEIEQARAARNAARAAVGVAASQLGDRYLVSTMDGVVLSRLLEAGETASAGMPVLKIADRKTLEVVASVEEVDLGRIAVGDTAYVVLDAMPDKTYEGKIIKIGSEVNNLNGTAEVKIKVTDPNLERETRFLPGMTADVNIITDHLKQAVVVPASSVGKDGGRYVVYEFSGGHVKTKPVNVKRISLEYFQVLDDSLKPGNWIARFASMDLLTKKRVAPMATSLESSKPSGG